LTVRWWWQIKSGYDFEGETIFKGADWKLAKYENIIQQKPLSMKVIHSNERLSKINTGSNNIIHLIK